MNKRWDLSVLYRDFSDEDFKKDFAQLEELIDRLQSWEKPASDEKVEGAEDFISTLKDFREKYSELMAFASLKLSVEADNDRAEKTVEKLDEKRSGLAGPMVSFQRWLEEVDLEELTSESPLLEEHSFVMEELKEKSSHLLSKEEEVLAAEMKRTGSSAWARLQQKLTSTLMVPIELDGEEKELPLPRVRNMAYENDPDLRWRAYSAELDAYEEIDRSVASALNGIKGEVLTLTEKKDYESPLSRTLQETRMEKETLDTLLEVMEDFLSDFHRYYRLKADLLGHEGGLPFYDLFAPVTEAGMEFTLSEARDFIIENVENFSLRMAELYREAFEGGWIDTEPREGKRGGAFCNNIHPVGESRILSNFSGSFSDMTTLAHELGHAYHGYCLKEESILNTDYPMPLAETASIFSETAVINAALEEADGDQTLAILQNRLDKAGQVIVDIYSRFLFEKELFSRRQEASLSVEELKEIMTDAQREAYGNGLDHDYLHPYMWLNKPHYYYAERNYYNFPYAFGLLFGLGIYALYQKRDNEKFLEDYDNLLAATGKNMVEEVAGMMDLDVQDRSFWEASLELIKKDIDKFEELA